MSQNNLEMVRRYSEDPPDEAVTREGVLKWMTEFWESDGDYYPVRKFPEARPCHGRFIRVEDHLTAKGALHALGLTGDSLEAAGFQK